MNISFVNQGSYKTEFEEEVITVGEKERVIVLHNDDYNTFDHVINSLVEICGHHPEQAEQCAYITHFNGKCDVKKGPEAILEKMYRKLKLRGLSVTLED
jgi:ATP-dependent Clp protease adaptor protein ClpS